MSTSITNGTHPQIQASISTPYVVALNVPPRGTSFDERVGNNVKFTNISYSAIIQKLNNNDQYASTTVKIFIVFAKDASDIFTLPEYLEQDMNGDYSPASYVNQQGYKRWIIPRG